MDALGRYRVGPLLILTTQPRIHFKSPLVLSILQVQSFLSFSMDRQAQWASSIPITRPEFMSVVPSNQLGITILHEEANAKVE